MKKNRFLVLALIVAFSTIATTGYAQIRLGLRGEVGLNNASFSKDAIAVENLNSFKLGPTVEMMLPIGIGIEAAVLYNNNKMEISESASSTLEITNHYIDIPVNAKFKFGLIEMLKVYGAAGPYARIHMSGDDIKISSVTNDIKTKDFEAGVNLGVGVELFKRLAVGVNYGIQLTDNYSVSEPIWSDALNNKEGSWSIQLSLYL